MSAQSPDCIHDNRTDERRRAASNCRTCARDNVEYQCWCAFWDALPYRWEWDVSKPDAVTFGGHWEVRATGEPVAAHVVRAHLRGMGVTVVGW